MPYVSETAWRNDWPISGTKAPIGVAAFRSHGIDFPGGLKRGDVAWLMDDLVGHLVQLERGVPGTCWSWSQPRPNRNNASQPSRHGAGIAIDWNSEKHPNGVKGTWGAHNRQILTDLLRDRYRGLIRCGEFYHRTTDGMHFEINGSPAEIAALVRTLKGQQRKAQRTLPAGRPPKWWTTVTRPGGRSQEVASALKVLADPALPMQVTLTPRVAAAFRNVARVYGLPQTGALTGDVARAIADWHRSR